MKTLLAIIFFITSSIFSQNIYFSIPLSSTVYHSLGGKILINYNFYHSNSIYVYRYYAQLTYPDGTKSAWQTEYNGSGETGGWWVTKAGTYKIEGKAWVKSVFGGAAYWTYRPIFSFIAIDDETPDVPNGLLTSWVNGGEEGGNPKIDWNANTEDDFSNYEVWKRIDNWSGSDVDWYLKATTISNNYIDYDEQGWGTFNPPRDVYYKIKAVDVNNNKSDYSSTVMFKCEQGLNKKSNNEIVSNMPLKFKLSSNYPNPFNPSTTIQYQLPKSSFVILKVLDVLGQEVALLVNEEQGAGTHNISFNASHLPSGLYFYEIHANNFTDVKKMLLAK